MEQLPTSIFLQPGKQTSLTPEIKKNISGMQTGSVLNKIDKILSYLKTLKITDFDEKLFRKRTAAEIIKEGFVTGCTDSDLVFVALARGCGIPTKYVETIAKTWLQGGGNSIQGHQYAQVFDDQNKKWLWVDPMGSRVGTFSPESDGSVVFKTGLDSWDIGIHNFNELKEEFNKFRSEWLKKQSIWSKINTAFLNFLHFRLF